MGISLERGTTYRWNYLVIDPLPNLTCFLVSSREKLFHWFELCSRNNTHNGCLLFMVCPNEAVQWKTYHLQFLSNGNWSTRSVSLAIGFHQQDKSSPRWNVHFSDRERKNYSAVNKCVIIKKILVQHILYFIWYIVRDNSTTTARCRNGNEKSSQR